MKLNEDFKNSEVAKVFGGDVDFNLKLTEKSLEHIIESFDYHSHMARSNLKYGAEGLNFNELLKGHVHLAVSDILKAVLRQLTDEEQHEKDWFAEEYMQNKAKDFSLLVRKIIR